MSPKKDTFQTFYAVSVAWQLGFFVALPLGGFLLLGIAGDKYFGTQPLLLFVGLAVGLLVTFYEVYHLLAPLLRRHSTQDD